jgi:hypothetical protein
MSDVHQADHLRRAGDLRYARELTEANLRFFQIPGNSNFSVESLCHRILGDLDADIGQDDSAGQHYDEALKIAYGVSFRPALIEALLARGRWYTRHMKDESAAFNDLDAALAYAVQGSYRIYEADIRVALAWAHLTRGLRLSSEMDLDAARAEAGYARRLSQEMEYRWGQLDAEEVIEKMTGDDR